MIAAVDAVRRPATARGLGADLKTAGLLLHELAHLRALDGLLRDAPSPALPAAELRRLERLPARPVDLAADHVMRSAAHALLSHGWRPTDVLRFVARRFDATTTAYAADVLGLAAQWCAGVDWLLELDDVGARQWWTAGDTHAAQWAERTATSRAGQLSMTVDILAVLTYLPVTLAAQPETPDAPPLGLGALVLDSRVVRKIDALFARAVGTSFVDEAMACAVKAQDLLVRHARLPVPRLIASTDEPRRPRPVRRPQPALPAGAGQPDRVA